jgi:hypothetical protein
MRSTEAARCAALVALVAFGSACTIQRTYLGSEILADPYEMVVVGASTKPQVLAHFGPPDRIVRQRDGDVFVYRYAQRNGFQLEIEEPFSGIEIFTWDRVQEKSDRLLVFFDRNGLVSAFGFRRGRAELQPL